MANAMAYAKYQAISLDAESAYEELYSRLARWTGEAAALLKAGDDAQSEKKLDRSIELLGYMDRGIDLSRNYDIAVSILSLHRFAIATLVKAKVERQPQDLDALVRIFVSLAEIFSAIRDRR